MIVDEITIRVLAGRGGDGQVSFSKVKMELGPTGGRGGNGGSVYFEGATDLSILGKYRHKKKFQADDGRQGKSDRSSGLEGKDLVILVPVGSHIRNVQTNEEFDIIETKEKFLAARGGIGGRGNFYFRSPINTSPEKAEEGKPGEVFDYEIELRLIADVGLIGLPSAGKSSLLNELTKAEAKVGDYHFTTLEPNLGVMGKLIIADIPGLIEGASGGKGLGVKFLKHIQRTNTLLHCLAIDSEDIGNDYRTVRKEMEIYDKKLVEKKEIVLLTKSDLADERAYRRKRAIIKEYNPDIMPVSIHDWDQLKKLERRLKTLD
jgi:GTPase